MTTLHEQKVLAYKTKCINGPKWTSKNNPGNMENLEKYLEEEKVINASEPWSKLDKTTKIKKLIVYAQEYASKYELSEEEHEKLLAFFKDCLDKKKLHRVKDVVYNKETGLVINIPSLLHNKTTNHYTLKNIVVEKKQKTTKNMKSIIE